VIAGSCLPFIAGWFGPAYLPPILIFDFVVAWSAHRLLDPRTLLKQRDIRRIYLTGTAMVLALIIIRLVMK
jgi:geranylgeranylglycerol-phosphate geranylgeranyltransferase